LATIIGELLVLAGFSAGNAEFSAELDRIHNSVVGVGLENIEELIDEEERRKKKKKEWIH
jgi:hypothetical protein